MIIEKDNGYIENNAYVLGKGWQGYYYKDIQAFKDKKGVCYIPEYNYGLELDGEEQSEQLVIKFEDVDKRDCYTYNSIIELVKSYFKYYNVELTDERAEEIGLDILELADWQHLDSLLDECEWEELIDELEELSREELLKLSLSYSDYIMSFYEDHDYGMCPVSIREYYNNDYKLKGDE